MFKTELNMRKRELIESDRKNKRQRMKGRKKEQSKISLQAIPENGLVLS